MQAVKVRVLSRLPLFIMKVTVENKKGLNKDLKVFVDKKTRSNKDYIDIGQSISIIYKTAINWASGGIGRRVGLRNQ